MGIVYKLKDLFFIDKFFIPTVFRLNILRTLCGFIEQYCDTGKKLDILDIGCGSGIYALYFLARGIKGHYLGIDNAIKFWDKEWRILSSLNKELQINFKSLDAITLSESVDRSFNIVICLVALEHIKKYDEVIKQISKVTAKDGYVLVIVPSKYTWLFSLGKHGYHFFPRQSIINRAGENNLQVIKYHNLGGIFGYLFDLNFYWGASLLCQFTDVDNFIAKTSEMVKEPYSKILNAIYVADKKAPLLESGYAYILKKNAS